MLSVFLTEHLEGHFKDTADVKVVYYFCNYLLRGTNSNDVLRTLLYQMLQNETQAASSLFDRYFSSEAKTKSTLSEFVPLWTMLETVLRQRLQHHRIIFVLDGMDECDPNSVLEISKKLAKMPAGEQWSTNLQTIVISRDIPRLRILPRIKLDPDHEEDVGRDIRSFVTERVTGLSFLDGYTEEFRVDLEKALLKRAAGTFLWIGFAVSELHRQETCSAVLQTARSFPVGLDAFYGRMLLQVDERRRSIVKYVLQWVALAERRLRLEEVGVIVDAIAEPGLTKEQAIRDVIRECGPMLRTETEKSRYSPSTRTMVVLVHQSARDYLLRRQPDCDNILEAFRVVPSNAHLEITRTCLLYLKTWGDNHDEAPLHDYAYSSWKDHAVHVASDERLLWRFQEDMLLGYDTAQRNQVHKFKNEVNYMREIRKKYGIKASPLQDATTRGIISWIETILEDAKSHSQLQSVLDARRYHVYHGDPSESALLHCAVWYQQQRVVELLLAQGASVNLAGGKRGATPLHVVRDDATIARLLISAGAKINALNDFHQTPLHCACQWPPSGMERTGKASVVELLLSAGAEINARDVHNRTPLHLACTYGGQTAVVELFIGAGAEINARNDVDETPLHLACEDGGQSAIVELLIGAGAEINARDEDSKTPLDVVGVAREESTSSVEIRGFLREHGAKLSDELEEGMPEKCTFEEGAAILKPLSVLEEEEEQISNCTTEARDETLEQIVFDKEETATEPDVRAKLPGSDLEKTEKNLKLRGFKRMQKKVFGRLSLR
jgi:ankyrin repeat protein